jgi:quercetin dioxygenase-like cupin family protein
MAPASEAIFHLLTDTPWETAADVPPELRALAEQRTGTGGEGTTGGEGPTSARRAQVTTGALGFHSQMSEFPPDFEVPPHSHSAHELMVVLEGGCEVGGGPVLTAGDMAEIPAGSEYGFTVGAQGMRIVVVRPEASTTRLS